MYKACRNQQIKPWATKVTINSCRGVNYLRMLKKEGACKVIESFTNCTVMNISQEIHKIIVETSDTVLDSHNIDPIVTLYRMVNTASKPHSNEICYSRCRKFDFIVKYPKNNLKMIF